MQYGPGFRQKLEIEVLQLQQNPEGFNQLALEVFEFQKHFNPVYQQFLKLTRQWGRNLNHWTEIPCLPISFFKTQSIRTGTWQEAGFFQSSGTTGQVRSRHPFPDLSFYHQISIQHFEARFGPLKDRPIWALLPNYQENPHSSLISMVEAFGKQSGQGVLYSDSPDFNLKIQSKAQNGPLPLVFAVTFSLLDWAERGKSFPVPVQIMETGGMKGLRREMAKAEILDILRRTFQGHVIHSEYGMTELFSQAYRTETEYETGSSMRVLAADPEDPLAPAKEKGRGLLNVFDLGNLHSCAFIATEDLTEVHSPTRFDVLGRLHSAEVRGCNLLFSNL